MNLDAIYDLYKTKELYDQTFYIWSIKEPEAKVLYDNVLDANKILVIGAYKGVSTLVILQAIDGRPFDCIYNLDIFLKDFKDTKDEDYYSVFKEMVLDRSWSGRVEVIRGFASATTLKHYAEYYQPELWWSINKAPDGLDLVFIDGDHAFPICFYDFLMVWPKMNKGGRVLLHDVGGSWAHELSSTVEYIKQLPDAQMTIHNGIDGIAVVTKV